MRPINAQRKLIEDKRDAYAAGRKTEKSLHFARMPQLRGVLEFLLRISHTKAKGVRNAADVQTEEVEVVLVDLPESFNGTRILFMTDLHLNASGLLLETIIRLTDGLEYDFCILGGDYSFGNGAGGAEAFSQVRCVASRLTEKSRVFGILGNYDRYDMAEVLDACGVEMLLNDNVCLNRGKDTIHLAGLDDSSSYEAADLGLAGGGIRNGAFTIMVCHSPMLYREVASAGYSLYLAGHTHGGQICLPGGVVLDSGTTAPRSLAKGKWRYGQMAGYTSRGIGTSGVNVRFFCPPEITLITLRNGR